ncbi:MAG: hypothetical protein ACYTHM_22105 [Planctomycetota bacterium]|jgi:hypothetical protein
MMRSRKLLFVGIFVGVGVLAASAALTLKAQEGDPVPPPQEPILNVLASHGDKTSTLTLLKNLSAPLPGREKSVKGGLSFFIPGPEQLVYFGDKRGVITFLRNLPRRTASAQILVRDAYRLEKIADKAETLTFLRALGERDAALDLLIVDLRGLAHVGKRASLVTFARNLPKSSMVHFYTTPTEMVQYGADADLLGFIAALTCPVEVHLDDPMLAIWLRRWEAQGEDEKKGE